MITKEQSKVVEFLSKSISKSYPIAELTKKIGKSSYTWTFNVIKALEKEGVVLIEKRSGVDFCKLNFNNPLTLGYISIAEILKLKNRKMPYKEVVKLLQLIPVTYFTMLVTGSYANGTATKHSDLDIVVLVDDSVNAKAIVNILESKGEIMIPKVHSYVFNKSEFLNMLLSKEMNYGKLIVENRIIVFGAENYYLILIEAIEHGFKN